MVPKGGVQLVVKSKLPVLLSMVAGMVLLAGLLPGCIGADNPKIVEVPNLKEIEGQVEKKTEPPIVRGKTLKKGSGYMKAFDKPANAQ